MAFTISEYDATTPFSPGPIVPGTWNILLGVAHVPAGMTSNYSIKITLGNKDDQVPVTVIRRGPAWYKGDLHSHTGHSDGICFSQSGKNVPCPAHKLIEAAAARPLDFLAVTDHNTASTLNQIREMQPYFDKILLIHGREMTTYNGHANVWGTAEFLDYRIGYKGWTINNFLDQVHQTAGLVSINHAYWPVSPACLGCGWGWESQTDFTKIDAIEALNGYAEKNGYYTPPPGNGIAFWEKQIAKGYRITAVGGGDDHRSGEQLDNNVGVGTPTTVVYADELSEKAILAGIKAGHVIIQRRGPNGPSILLTSGKSLPGDNVVSRQGEAEFHVTVSNCERCKTVLYLDGKPVSVEPLRLRLDGTRHWVRAELLDAAGEVAAMTNPIYFNYSVR